MLSPDEKQDMHDHITHGRELFMKHQKGGHYHILACSRAMLRDEEPARNDLVYSLSEMKRLNRKFAGEGIFRNRICGDYIRWLLLGGRCGFLWLKKNLRTTI